MEARNLRKERTGVVLSNKMEKTITVAAKFKEKHPIYGKFVSKTKKYHAHDEKNECNIGDKMCIRDSYWHDETMGADYTVEEIKEMTTNDLVERVEAETANYNQMVINHSISPLENPAQIKQLRRTIARMKTELRERELNNK